MKGPFPHTRERREGLQRRRRYDIGGGEMYDLAILGGGPGGLRTAELAAAAGMNTIVIEKDRLGGSA